MFFGTQVCQTQVPSETRVYQTQVLGIMAIWSNIMLGTRV